MTPVYRSAVPPGDRTTNPGGDFPATAALSAYVGDEGLMDFVIESRFQGGGKTHRDAITLACASKMFFAGGLKSIGPRPLLWTRGLMAPEAYTLKTALDAWIAGESSAGIRERAAAEYAKYQKCSVAAAPRLISSGW